MCNEMNTPRHRWIRTVAALAACLTLTGCASVVDSVLGNPDSCRENCEDTYDACLEQVGTPDAEHYCLTRRNQCLVDC